MRDIFASDIEMGGLLLIFFDKVAKSKQRDQIKLSLKYHNTWQEPSILFNSLSNNIFELVIFETRNLPQTQNPTINVMKVHFLKSGTCDTCSCLNLKKTSEINLVKKKLLDIACKNF